MLYLNITLLIYIALLIYYATCAGPYIAGEEVSLADATVFPTIVFVTYMLPLFVGVENLHRFEDWNGFLGSNVVKWFHWIKDTDEVGNW